MIGPGSGIRVYLACGITDMRKGIGGLAMLAQDVLSQTPAGDAVFAFRGRRGDRVVKQLILHAHLGIHLLQPAVLFGHVLHLGNQRCVHAAKLGPPFVKAGTAHPMIAAQLRDRHTALRLLQDRHDLRVSKGLVDFGKWRTEQLGRKAHHSTNLKQMITDAWRWHQSDGYKK